MSATCDAGQSPPVSENEVVVIDRLHEVERSVIGDVVDSFYEFRNWHPSHLSPQRL
jgi:hypothetical protein